jgi:hypothetical protein
MPSMCGNTKETGCPLPTKPDEQLFVRSSTVVSRVLGGETLIVPIRGKVGDLASIYSFNGTGSLIWQRLASPKGLSDLIDIVEREYAVERERAQRDVVSFVNEMLSVGLLERSPLSAMAAMGTSKSKKRLTNEQETLETAGSR